MLIILIDRLQVLSYLIRMSLFNQANHTIWQKSWSSSIVLTVFPWTWKWFLEVKKSLSVFVLDSKAKEDDKVVLQRVGFEISRERQGLLLQSRKMAKRWQRSWKTHWNYRGIEFHEFLSERSKLFTEAAKRPSKQRSHEIKVPRHIKIRQKDFLKVYCSGRASRKTPGSGLLSIIPGKCRTFRKCIEWKGIGSTWLVRCENENCPFNIITRHG